MFEKTMQRLGGYCEGLITEKSPGGKLAFFEPDSFPWIEHIEKNWHVIREELDALLVNRSSIPNFQDISKRQARLTQDDRWKTFFLYSYGRKAKVNCARCPQTAKLLKKIPGMTTAMFSILAPGKHIPRHRGPYKGVLRYHLGVIVPPPEGACRIRVRDEIRSWSEGKSLVFDDSHVHEAWNDSDGIRVVLFVDIIRPLPFPLSILNRFILWLVAHSEDVKEAMENIQRPVQVPS